MSLPLKISLIASISAFLNVLVPGLCIVSFIKKKLNENYWGLNSGILVIASGFVFNLLLFLALLILLNYGWKNQYDMVIGAYGLDILLLVGLSTIYSKQFQSALKTFCEFLLRPSHFIIFVLITIFCCFGIYNYPHTLDCGQLKWTLLLLDQLTSNPFDSSGALGYSALIFPPAVIFKQLPLATLAAGFKLMVGWLFAFAGIYLIEKAEFKYQNFSKLLLFFITITTFFGFYGVYQLGKDSIVGVLFSILYIATLLEQKESKSFYVRSGLLLLCSITAGVITVPYLFLITLCYFLFNLRRFQKPFLFLFYLLTFSSIGLILNINAMIKFHLSYLMLAIGSLALFFYALKNVSFFNFPVSRSIKISHWLFSISLLMLIVVLYFLMPIKVPIIGWNDSQGHPMIFFYEPFDGKISFIHYLIYGQYTKSIYLVLGLIGMFAFIWHDKYRQVRALYALSLLPFVVLLAIIGLAHWKHSPFTGFNLWDMGRDVTAYYYPYIFGLFVLLLVDLILNKISTLKIFSNKEGVWKGLIGIAGILTLVFAWSSFYKKDGYSFKPVTYTEVNGDQNTTFADLTYTFLKNKFNANTVFFDQDSAGYAYFYSYQMFSNDQFFPLDLNDATALKSLGMQKSYLMVLNRKNVDHFLRAVQKDSKTIRLVNDYENTDTVLYEVS